MRNDFRQLSCALLCVCALGLTAASLNAQNAQSAQSAPDASEAAARAVAGELGARQFDKVAARFNETMAKALSVERLASTWDQVTMQFGEFKSAGSARSGDAQGQHFVILTCTFESGGTLYITVAFDAAAKLAGLLITPQPPPI